MFRLPPPDSRRAALLALVPLTLGWIVARLPLDWYAVAWLHLVPLILWAGAAPKFKGYAWKTFLALWLGQIGELFWLRHVYPPLGYLAVVLLTAYLALFPTLWALAARWLLPKAETRSLAARVADMLALAGLWIVLEWLKGRLFTGFPWMPLAATQWQVPSVLSTAAFAGPAGPGFIIVLFNLAFARYARWLTGRNNAALVRTGMPVSPWSGFRMCPEFYVGLLPIFLSFWLFLQNARRTRETLFSAAVVQTDFDPNAKWDPKRDNENARIIREITHVAAGLGEKSPSWEYGSPKPEPAKYGRPDVVLWPESALRFPVGRADYDDFLRETATHEMTTLLIGGDKRGEADPKSFYGGIFQVKPATGVDPVFYAKRHLVPFGEYVPFASVNPLRKVIPVDMLHGENPDPLDVVTRDGDRLKLGALVCYEDIFPELGRDLAARGADALVVVTNDAWYGREAGAYQHAATASMLAVSTGLPILRCGNAGWSGVISPLGGGDAVKNAAGTVYFRGAGRVEVRGFARESRTPTYYVRHGDWFVACGAAFFGLALIRGSDALVAREKRRRS